MRKEIGLTAVLLVVVVCSGCVGRPNPANIELRKQNQQLRDQVAELTALNDQLQSDVRRLESDRPTVVTLPQERLAELWTVAGLRFGRLRQIEERSEGRPLKIALRPVDAEGATLKAAGSFVVEAFDLDAQDVRLARWEIPTAEARKHWLSGGLINEYVLTLPWPAEPPAEGRKLLVRATFTDALTGRSFEAKADVR